MPDSIRYVAAPLLAAFWFAPVPAQTADGLFDSSLLHEVRLYLHENDWQALQANYLDNTYYQADLLWGDSAVAGVGIRSRGRGSRNPQKPGLRVDFNRFVPGQQFAGLTSLVLDNKTQDPSFLEEHLSMRLFSRLGIAAPRESFARLFVNDRYWGLYSLVEPVDKRFLRRVFQESGGNLYEYNWGWEYWFQAVGDDPSLLIPVPFQPRTNGDHPDAAALLALVRTINTAGDAEFETRISEFLDLPQLVRYVAAENFLAETDGFLGDVGMNNFYLYQRAGARRFELIPWDKDSAFMMFDFSITRHLDRNVLVRRVLAIPAYARLYLETLRELALDSAGEGNWMPREAAAAYELIRDSAHQDPHMPQTVAEFENEVYYAFAFLNLRGQLILEQLAGLAPPEPPPAPDSGFRPASRP